MNPMTLKLRNSTRVAEVLGAVAAFRKTNRKEMNSEKSSSVCKQKYKGIKRVHKLKYLLGRKRRRLNY